MAEKTDDEAPRPREAGDEHGRPSPGEQIEAEIEETREELGDTVGALADKTDVKKQAKQKAEETKDAAQAKARERRPTSAKQTFEGMPRAAGQADDARRGRRPGEPGAGRRSAPARCCWSRSCVDRRG